MLSGPNLFAFIAAAIFFVLGIIVLLLGRMEEQSYYNALSRKRDLREFVSHKPERAAPPSLIVGGWILLAMGVGLFVLWWAISH